MELINISDINIRSDRQRKDFGNLEELKKSILNIGLLNPVILEAEAGQYFLLAGERRFRAWSELVREKKIEPFIPCKLLSELDEKTRQIIELEENIKRKDLTWQEYVLALMKVYELSGCESDLAFAEYMGIDRGLAQRAHQIYSNRDNEKVWNADNMSAALTICKRENARILDSAKTDLDFIIATDLQEFVDPKKKEISNGQGRIETEVSGIRTTETNDLPKAETRISEQKEEKYKIQQGDFLNWARNYNGKRFNLIHLDFPYGINHDKSAQGNTKNFGAYEDSEDTYKTLVKVLLENQEKIIADSAHVICWLSFRYFEWTKEEFAKAGFSCHMQPFIWHKSDNKGIIADTMCGMRNIGEYALIFNKGRRPVIKNISNIYSHPTTKRFHVSEKPLPVLEYLFSAFCDNNSRVLDPTCGSGTAIMAAAHWGAEEGLGLELDSSFAEKAQEWLRIESKKAEGTEALDIDLNLDI